MVVLLVSGAALGGAAALTLSAMGSSMAYFLAPSQVTGQAVPGRTFRLGGMVKEGTLVRSERDGEPSARFVVTDGKGSVLVTYTGILPDLFREGQGVVALGSIGPGGVFDAEQVLAKHDESYMPKEVADALKKAGHWNPAAGAPPPAESWDKLLTAAKASGT
jgi:cytochrome c-type biogenesis protein CcmE